MSTIPASPRIEQLAIRNYRAFHHQRFTALTPLTVLLGPNGSGKSTVFDVFAFLSECFTVGLRKAWDKRGRFKELRSRGAEGTISFELTYHEKANTPLMTYRLVIDENRNGPLVAEEQLLSLQGSSSRKILDFRQGRGSIANDTASTVLNAGENEKLNSPDILAATAFGQLSRHTQVNVLWRFITGWYLSSLTTESARSNPQSGPQERLTASGDNLANVLLYMKEQHPERLRQILQVLSRRVPQLEGVEIETNLDGRLQLQIKDVPFDKPIAAQYVSEGTLKLLAYLLILNDPEPPALIGIEEPENHLHHGLLSELAEECRIAAARSQVLVTTHSPAFLNSVRAEEAWVLSRNKKGYTQARCAADIQGVKDFMAEGALLGQLWSEGYLDAKNGS